MSNTVIIPYLVILLECTAIAHQDHPWSPIVQGKAVVPPVIQPSAADTSVYIVNAVTEASLAASRRNDSRVVAAGSINPSVRLVQGARRVQSVNNYNNPNTKSNVISRNLSENIIYANNPYRRYYGARTASPMWRRRRRRKRPVYYPYKLYSLRPQLRSFTTGPEVDTTAAASSVSTAARWRIQSPFARYYRSLRAQSASAGLSPASARWFPARYRGLGGSPRATASLSAPRARVNRPRARAIQDEGFEFNLASSIRSIFGVSRSSDCVNGDGSSSCTLTPVCWLTGGIATEGKLSHVIYQNLSNCVINKDVKIGLFSLDLFLKSHYYLIHIT